MTGRERTKVLFVGHSAGRTGAPIVLAHLLRWLRANSDLELTLLLGDDGPMRSEYSRICPTHVFESALGRMLRLARVKRSVATAATRGRRRRVPVAVARAANDLVYANSITTGPILEQLGRPRESTLVHVHELAHWIERSGPENLASIRRRTSRMVAASGAVREALVRRYGFSADSVEVVHEFIALPDPETAAARRGTRQRLGVSDEEFLVLGSGFESWRKGKDLFVELASRIRDRDDRRSIRLVWTGGWENRQARSELLGAVAERGLGHRLKFVGEVERPFDYLAAADAFALVSREDPFPLVAIEAAAMSLPVLCFADAGGAPELVEDDAGRIVAFEDVDAMAATIGELAADGAATRRMGAKGAAKVRERYDVEIAGPRLLELVVGQIRDATARPARAR